MSDSRFLGVLAPIARLHAIKTPQNLGASIRRASKCRRIVRQSVSLFCCASGLAAGAAVADDAALRARFLAEAPTAWSTIIELSKRADVEVIVRTHELGYGDVEMSMESRMSGENFLFEAKWIKKEPPDKSFRVGREEVECVNSKYGFSIMKTSPDAPWQIQSINNERVRMAEYLLTKVGVGGNSLIALCVRGEFLPDWFREKGFRVKGVEPARRAAGELVAVHFETDRRPPAKEGVRSNTHWYKSGVLYLNPERLWAIEEFEVQAEFLQKGGTNPQTYTGKSEFGPSADKYPIVLRSKLIGIWGATNEPPFVQDWEFTRFELHDIPESEFRLSAFGFPEVGAPTLLPTLRLWMALVGLGILCIVIALFIRVRSAVA